MLTFHNVTRALSLVFRCARALEMTSAVVPQTTSIIGGAATFMFAMDMHHTQGWRLPPFHPTSDVDVSAFATRWTSARGLQTALDACSEKPVTVVAGCGIPCRCLNAQTALHATINRTSVERLVHWSFCRETNATTSLTYNVESAAGGRYLKPLLQVSTYLNLVNCRQTKSYFVPRMHRVKYILNAYDALNDRSKSLYFDSGLVPREVSRWEAFWRRREAVMMETKNNDTRAVTRTDDFHKNAHLTVDFLKQKYREAFACAST